MAKLGFKQRFREYMLTPEIQQTGVTTSELSAKFGISQERCRRHLLGMPDAWIEDYGEKLKGGGRRPAIWMVAIIPKSKPYPKGRVK